MAVTYDSRLYDIFIPESFGGDTEWYRRKARDANGPVLELGAGTGRITIPIARDGVSIDALEPDPSMIVKLRRKLDTLPDDARARVTIVEADMRTFALDRRFALIIAPFRAFLHNLTREDQLACLQRVHAHLQPGGRFAFNIFHPSLEFMSRHVGPLQGVWRWTATHALPDGGHAIRNEANRYDTVRRRVFSLHRYEEYDANGELTRTFLHRLEIAMLYEPDVRQLLKDAGFGAVTIHGGFDERPFEHDTDEMVIEANRD